MRELKDVFLLTLSKVPRPAGFDVPYYQYMRVGLHSMRTYPAFITFAWSAKMTKTGLSINRSSEPEAALLRWLGLVVTAWVYCE